MRYRVKFGDLPNGMRYYNFFDRAAHLGGVGVRAGSLHDPPGKDGLAHLTEHVITRESRKYNDLEVDLMCQRYMGGPDDDIAIHTTFSYTFYGCEHLEYHRYFKAVFDMMASFVDPKAQLVNEEGVLSEVTAVQNEYFLRGVDLHESELYDELRRRLYRANPIRKRVDCDLSHLDTMTLRDVKSFLRSWYVPSNMFLVIIGPSFEEAKRIAEAHFGDFEGPAPAKFPYHRFDKNPTLRDVKRIEMPRRGTHQYHVAMAFPTDVRDSVALETLAWLLEFRLRRSLRSQRYGSRRGVYRVEVQNDQSFVHGMLVVRFATTSREFVDEAEEIILRETKALCASLVSPEELSAACGRMRDIYYSGFRSSVSALRDRINEATANGDPDLLALHKFPAEMKAMGRRKILAMANKYLARNYMKLVFVPA